MRFLTQKDGGLSTYFDKIDEREAGITNTSLVDMLIDGNTNEDESRKRGANFPLENIFDFCKTLENNKRPRI